MSFRHLLITLGLLSVLSLLVLWLLHKRGISTIPPNTDATISVEGNRITIEKNNERIVRYAPNGTKITINKDGSVKVTTKQYGVCREMGLGMMVEDRRLMPVVDIKLLYVNRFGLHVGLGLDVVTPHLADVFHPVISLSYNLPITALSNTSVFIGHSVVSANWVTGIRVSF